MGGGGGDDETNDPLVRQMNDLVISDPSVLDSGYNFSVNPPYLFWSFYHNGIKFMKYEFLVHGGSEDDYDARISNDGMKLIFKHMIPHRFPDMERILRAHARDIPAFQIGNPEAIAEAMYEEGKKLMQTVMEVFFDTDNQSVTNSTEIKLPMQVQQQFQDPYYPNSSGKFLRNHPVRAGHNMPRFYVYHVHLRSAAMPRTPQQTQSEAVDC